ncbi:MAG: class II glutamine amidotransferase [Candidatus Thermoplasmatota archaeon]|nr:class II glutamine amidotransferase [Candidatus Thermoplasmatota archaeon]
MCRLFAVIAKEPKALKEWLIESKNSILEQSKEHRHGWGLAWLENRNFRIDKSTTPAYKDKTFLALAQMINSKLNIVHIRKASVATIKLENNQPFIRGKWVFTHNGTISNYKKLLPLINVKHLRGETDSEVFFQLLMKNLKKLCAEKAISKTVADIARLCRYSSLNCVFSEGEKLYALRMYKKEPSYYRMNYLMADECVVVSSEKIGNGKWEKMNNHELMVVDKKCNIKRIAV